MYESYVFWTYQPTEILKHLWWLNQVDKKIQTTHKRCLNVSPKHKNQESTECFKTAAMKILCDGVYLCPLSCHLKIDIEMQFCPAFDLSPVIETLMYEVHIMWLCSLSLLQIYLNENFVTAASQIKAPNDMMMYFNRMKRGWILIHKWTQCMWHS